MYSLDTKKNSTSYTTPLASDPVRDQNPFRAAAKDDFLNPKSKRQDKRLQFQQEDEAPLASGQAAAKGPDSSNYKDMQIGTYGDFDLNGWDSKKFKKDFDIQYEGALPKAVKNKLKLVADNLLFRNGRVSSFGSFSEDFTLSLAINGAEFTSPPLSKDDKKKYAGDTVFEIIRLKDTKGKKPSVFVRELGKDNSGVKNTVIAKKVFEKYFTVDASWGDEKELELLYNSVSKIPESILGKVPKIVFSRKPLSDGDAKKKNPNTMATHSLSRKAENTITVFDLAFTPSHVRFGDSGQGFSDSLAQTIVHEIGHALDSAKVQKTLKARSDASDRWSRAMDERKANAATCADPPDMLAGYCKGIEDRNRYTFSDYLAKDKDNQAARTETGEEYNPHTDDMLLEDPAADTEFLKALKQDGNKASTLYASKSKQENFAELFSFYILDTKRFKLVFPNVYLYFEKHFPK